MRNKGVIVYVDAAQLRRQAAAWAKGLAKQGVRIGQPQSAYVRYLLDRDEEMDVRGAMAYLRRKAGKHGA